MRIKNILVVDDEPKVLESLGIILSKRGYIPTLCKNGKEAMEELEKKRFCLGLLDMVLPDMDGIEILKAAKEKNPLSEMLIITGCEKIDIAIKAIQYQACDFLVKPIEPDFLYHSVKRAEEMFQLRLKDLLHTKSLERVIRLRTERLIKAEKQALIGSSVQGVVHNIINPLTIITGRVELLKKELTYLSEEDRPSDSLDSVCRGIDAIYENSQRIFQIVDNILKKSSKEQQKKRTCIDINSLIFQEIEFFNSDLYFKHNVKASYQLDPDLDKVYMIYSHLSQVIDNLIKNAIEAMYESPEKDLTVRTYKDENFIYISIMDTGIGISPEIKKKIFEPFFSTKASFEGEDRVGNGLGLHTCLELLMPYAGDIHVESEPGIGSTFIISLPRSLSQVQEICEKENTDRLEKIKVGSV